MSTYKVGTRVELHPGRDEWMQGDRYGEVVKNVDGQGKTYKVKLDKSQRTIFLRAEDILRQV